MKKVFLGGTVNSIWREKLIPMLKINQFNPLVEHELCIKEEYEYYLYVITPSMTGVYNIAEVIDDSNKRPTKTIFCLLEKEIPIIVQVANPACYVGSSDMRMSIDTETYPSNKRQFDRLEMKSLNQVGEMVVKNGGTYLTSLESVVEYINENSK